MSDFKSMDEAMAAGAARAVQLAAEGGVVLDYSLDSIKVVEQQLARLHDQIPRGFIGRLTKKKPSDQEITMMSFTFGAYIAEVLKRVLGGSWSDESALHPGQSLPTFHVGTLELWPQIKVEKRLRDGPEDNVWDYVQVFVEKLRAPD